jgi:hypothetical protein
MHKKGKRMKEPEEYIIQEFSDFAYTWQQGVRDGILVKVFENRWPELSSGIPILATAHLFECVSLAALREIWNEYVVWVKNVMSTLPEEEQMFVTTMNGDKVWVINSEICVTMMYPEDY